MGDSEEVLYGLDESGRVATVTINRPDRRNALSWDVVRGLRGRVAEAKADAAVRVLVLTGAGDKAFCAGADLDGMGSGSFDFVAKHGDRGELAGLFTDLWALGKPTIARVRGFALAGGFALALSADIVIASEDSTFGAPEIDVGLWPFMATIPFIRSMPPKVALELMLTGRRVPADEGARIGFLNRVVPAGDLDAEVAEMAGTLASKAPNATRLGRDSFYSVLDTSAAEALAQLHPLLSVSAAGPEAAEGIAAFKEKRRPNWE